MASKTSNYQEALTIEEMVHLTPEGKLELVSGQLLAGNGLDGSRLLLQQLIRGWGTEAAIALGELDVWEEALREVYQLRFDDDEVTAATSAFNAPDYSRGAADENGMHWQTHGNLRMALHQASRSLGGHALSGHYTMKLGEDGFTPDLFYFNGLEGTEFYQYYLDGPAEFVIEITRPAHESYDRVLKRDLYALGGVLEYLIVNPARKEAELFRLANGEYQLQAPETDGCLRLVSVPGLAIKVEKLFSPEHDAWYDDSPFVIERSFKRKREGHSRRDGWEWGSMPFAPRFGLEPEPILFAEYISWCPEGKFEWWDGKPFIGGREATRNVLGMLLMSIGLHEAVTMRPASDWVNAVKNHRRKAREDAALRAHWWRKVEAVAGLLRDKYDIKRIGVTGDLLAPRPLHYWSELEIVGWDVPREKSHLVHEDLLPYQDEMTPVVYFTNAEDSSFVERQKRTSVPLQELK